MAVKYRYEFATWGYSGEFSDDVPETKVRQLAEAYAGPGGQLFRMEPDGTRVLLEVSAALPPAPTMTVEEAHRAMKTVEGDPPTDYVLL